MKKLKYLLIWWLLLCSVFLLSYSKLNLTHNFCHKLNIGCSYSNNNIAEWEIFAWISSPSQISNIIFLGDWGNQSYRDMNNEQDWNIFRVPMLSWSVRSFETCRYGKFFCTIDTIHYNDLLKTDQCVRLWMDRSQEWVIYPEKQCINIDVRYNNRDRIYYYLKH